jgi:hypothetical protein
VAYLQFYTTDKSVTYHPRGRSHAKEITIGEAMDGSKSDEYTMGLYGTYLEAAKNTPSNARMEVRVPIEFARDVLIDIDQPTLQQSLLSFPKKYWW